MTHESTAARRIRESLRISWQEGSFASAMLAVVEHYLVPLALFVGSTTKQVGLLVSLPQLLGSLAQLAASRLVRLTGSRVRFLVLVTSLQAAVLLPVALLALRPSSAAIGMLLMLMIAFRVMMGWLVTVNGSLLSDYLKPEDRGRYLGWRARILGIAGLIGMASAGTWLFWTKPRMPALGFCLLFLGASACRGISARLIARMVDMPLPHAPPRRPSRVVSSLRRLRSHNVFRYILYISSYTFAVYLVAPFFSVYMLRDLRFHYLQYMGVHLAAMIAGMLSAPIWGRHADVIGNARILRTTGLLITMIPVWWTVGRHPIYLMGVEWVAGFLWGGFLLCATNFIYDAVPPRRDRVKALSAFNLMQGVAVFAGVGLGGLIADHLPAVRGSSLMTLALLSAMLRVLVWATLSRRFHEVRASAKRVSSREFLFSIVGLRTIC